MEEEPEEGCCKGGDGRDICVNHTVIPLPSQSSTGCCGGRPRSGDSDKVKSVNVKDGTLYTYRQTSIWGQECSEYMTKNPAPTRPEPEPEPEKLTPEEEEALREEHDEMWRENIKLLLDLGEATFTDGVRKGSREYQKMIATQAAAKQQLEGNFARRKEHGVLNASAQKYWDTLTAERWARHTERVEREAREAAEREAAREAPRATKKKTKKKIKKKTKKKTKKKKKKKTKKRKTR